MDIYNPMCTGDRPVAHTPWFGHNDCESDTFWDSPYDSMRMSNTKKESGVPKLWLQPKLRIGCTGEACDY